MTSTLSPELIGVLPQPDSKTTYPMKGLYRRLPARIAPCVLTPYSVRRAVNLRRVFLLQGVFTALLYMKAKPKPSYGVAGCLMGINPFSFRVSLRTRFAGFVRINFAQAHPRLIAGGF